jgi:LSD1 subclass zinc finger protein
MDNDDLIKVYKKISDVNDKIFKQNYFNNSSFIKNNDFYENIKLNKPHDFKPSIPGNPGKGRKQCCTIGCPYLFYKRGFRNIKCSHQHTINSIGLYLCDKNNNEHELTKLYNPNGAIFKKLRQLLKIDDPLIIPLITEKFIPFLEDCCYKLYIQYNGSNDLNELNTIDLSYEIVEIESDNCFIPVQYNINMNKIININKHHEDISRIIPELEYIVSRVEYTGSEWINKKHSIRLGFNGFMRTILIHTPENSVVNCGIRIILDNNEEIQIPVKICFDKEFTVINFLPENKNKLLTIKEYGGIHGHLDTIEIFIDIELEKSYPENGSSIEIFGMNDFIYKISNGLFNKINTKY